MHRIDHTTADVTDPLKPVYTEGNPALGIPATIVTDDWLNDVQENIMKVIEEAGISPTKGDDSDLLNAIQQLASGGGGITGVVIVSSTTTLNAASVGYLHLLGTGDFTVTLPAADDAGITAEKSIWFHNRSTENVTISRAGTDTLGVGTGNVNTLVLMPGETLRMTTNGEDTWFADYNRNAGNTGAHVSVTSNTTITAQANGRFHIVGNDVEVTLPLISTCPSGTVFHFISSSNGGGRVIRRQGSDVIAISGLGSITSIGLADGESVSIVSNGTSWNLLSRAQPGTVVGRAYAEWTSVSSPAGTIPFDNTIPQSNEGTEVLTATITPKKTTNRIRARLVAHVSHNSAGLAVAALFRGSDTNAFAAGVLGNGGGNTNAFGALVVEGEVVAGTTSDLTIRVRAAGSGGFSFNTYFGTAGKTTLVLEEIES